VALPDPQTYGSRRHVRHAWEPAAQADHSRGVLCGRRRMLGARDPGADMAAVDGSSSGCGWWGRARTTSRSRSRPSASPVQARLMQNSATWTSAASRAATTQLWIAAPFAVILAALTSARRKRSEDSDWRRSRPRRRGPGVGTAAAGHDHVPAMFEEPETSRHRTMVPPAVDMSRGDFRIPVPHLVHVEKSARATWKRLDLPPPRRDVG
jgi:hypothetical protein